MGRAAQAIRCIDVFRTDFELPVPVGPSVLTYDRRSAILVRVEDEAGRVGWGETYYGDGTLAVLDALAEWLLAQEPVHRARLADELTRRTHDRMAVSVLTIALDDLRGRQLGVPVAELYGGRRRDWVLSYASSGGYRDDQPIEQSWPAELEAARADGFRAAKFRIGRHAPHRELPVLRELRNAAGPDFQLMVDANGAYSVPVARRVGRGLSELEYRWFEEPLTRFAHGLVYPGYEQLADLDVPIAAAEGLDTRSAFEAFLARGAASIVQPDVAICGGIAEARFVAELAGVRGRQCVPHAWGGAVLIAATLHLLALLPDPSELPGVDAPLLEVDRLHNPLRTELWGGEIRPTDGALSIPTGPGLGIDVDEDTIRRLSTAHRRHALTDR
jgi:D-galactarolactone cycloisomerase